MKDKPKYRVKIDGELIVHDFMRGDRVKGTSGQTGTIEKVTDRGLFIMVKWDIEDRYGRRWLPISLVRIPENRR